jgi:hypothetical protein
MEKNNLTSMNLSHKNIVVYYVLLLEVVKQVTKIELGWSKGMRVKNWL